MIKINDAMLNLKKNNTNDMNYSDKFLVIIMFHTFKTN